MTHIFSIGPTGRKHSNRSPILSPIERETHSLSYAYIRDVLDSSCPFQKEDRHRKHSLFTHTMNELEQTHAVSKKIQVIYLIYMKILP